MKVAKKHIALVFCGNILQNNIFRQKGHFFHKTCSDSLLPLYAKRAQVSPMQGSPKKRQRAVTVCYILYISVLKLVSAIFYQIFIFSSNDRPSKTMKNVHVKSSFRSRDIQIFLTFSLPFHTFQIQKGKWKWNNL